jgi:hypothetical protein
MVVLVQLFWKHIFDNKVGINKLTATKTTRGKINLKRKANGNI